MSWGLIGAAFELAAVDLLLGGDNAILIALAARVLPQEDRARAMAAEAAAKAMADLAARGLAGTVPGITALRKNLKKRPNWRRLSESNEFLESRC